MAERFRLDMKDGGDALKVLLYSLVSAVIVALISWWQGVSLPMEWAWAIPVVNTLLVVAKDFFQNR